MRGRQLSLRQTGRDVSALLSTHSLKCKESIKLGVRAMTVFSFEFLQRTEKLSEHRSMVRP